MTVVPLAMGLVTNWLGAALGTPAMIKKAAEDHGLTEASALIPTTTGSYPRVGGWRPRGSSDQWSLASLAQGRDGPFLLSFEA